LDLPCTSSTTYGHHPQYLHSQSSKSSHQKPKDETCREYSGLQNFKNSVLNPRIDKERIGELYCRMKVESTVDQRSLASQFTSTSFHEEQKRKIFEGVVEHRQKFQKRELADLDLGKIEQLTLFRISSFV